MAKLVKLGKKANSFSCPTTGVSVSTKDQIVELTPKQEKSKKIEKALQGGHLVYATEKEFNAQGNTEDSDEDSDEATVHTSTSLKKLKVDELKVIANSLLTDEIEETEDDIEVMKKDDLIEFILDNQEEDENEE